MFASICGHILVGLIMTLVSLVMIIAIIETVDYSLGMIKGWRGKR